LSEQSYLKAIKRNPTFEAESLRDPDVLLIIP